MQGYLRAIVVGHAPIKIATIDNSAGDSRPVTRHPLGQGMNHHVGAMFNGLTQIGWLNVPSTISGTLCFEDFGDRRNVKDVQARVEISSAKTHLALG